MVLIADKRKKLVKKASKMIDPSKCFDSTSNIKSVFALDDEKFNLIFCWANHLTDAQTAWIFDLFKRNMRDFYLASSWGYDEHSKKQELFAMTSRYLILENLKGIPVAYIHYRFIIENLFPVLYCYEIQLEKDYQKKGLGSKLLNLLEILAEKTGMEKVMATVFKFNAPSLKFFNKLNYTVDEMCQSTKYNLDFQILSKKINL